jgi:hypothetical protein
VQYKNIVYKYHLNDEFLFFNYNVGHENMKLVFDENGNITNVGSLQYSDVMVGNDIAIREKINEEILCILRKDDVENQIFID